MMWARHTARMVETKTANIILAGKTERKRTLGRLRR
jgi:hypothetical protein